ncbi:MAG: DMT family transporter, partial [Robiginitomaculum sp.]|nr:DMT family transporter [Robiginitomaculum sp.]
LLDFTGLQYITAQLERLILFTYPAFVMILGALFFGKKMRLRSIAFMGIAYLGLALIFVQGSIATGDKVSLGTVLVLGAAISFALFQLLAGAQIKKFGASLFTCVAMLAAGFGIVVQFTLQSVSRGNIDNLLAQPQEIWMIGLGIALISTLLPSFLINVALGRIGAQMVAVIGMISPLSTILLAVTLLGEPFGPIDAIGTAITMLGVGLFTWFDRKKTT